MWRFGPWDLEDVPECTVPVGQLCLRCEEPIASGDSGVMMPLLSESTAQIRPLHKECFLRGVFGSVGHQMGLCPCKGGILEDPPNMTRRQAAQAAVEYMRKVGYHNPVKDA